MSRRVREILPAAARPERRVPRKARVAGEVMERLQRALGSLRDPRVGAVSITRVVLSDDLSSARVFVRIAFGDNGPSEQRALMRALAAATGRLRHMLASELGLRYVPALYFAYDEGLDDARRVAELLDEIAREAPPSPRASDAEPERAEGARPTVESNAARGEGAADAPRAADGTREPDEL